MRKASVQFSCMHPGKRYRHEKPDLKVLLEKKEETYVDVSNATWLTILWIGLCPIKRCRFRVLATAMIVGACGLGLQIVNGVLFGKPC